MSKRQSNSTMQSEIFIVLMIVMVLLFIITSFYISKLKEHEQPPLIVLDEAHGYSFSISSAILSREFTTQLEEEVINDIKEYSKQYKCDTVEIHGYTDGQPFTSNTIYNSQSFDRSIHRCLVEDSCDIDSIRTSSNLELGMKRAVSVVQFLQPILVNSYSPIKRILPYSGGALIDAKGKIAKIEDRVGDRYRRRIEIRLSRSHDLH